MPTPGDKFKSKGEGRGLARGEAEGPLGIPGSKTRPLSKITCGEITRLLRTVRNLKGNVYVVGGIVTEGSTLKDIDIVISNVSDIPQLKKALGKYSNRAHFILQKEEPPGTLFVKVTGKEGTSPDLSEGKSKIPKNEYAT